MSFQGNGPRENEAQQSPQQQQFQQNFAQPDQPGMPGPQNQFGHQGMPSQQGQPLQQGQQFQQGQPFQQPQGNFAPQIPNTPPTKKNWFMRHKIITGLLVAVVGIGILANLGSSSDPAEPQAKPSDSASPTDSSKSPEPEKETEKPAENETEKPKEEPKEEPAGFKIGDVAKAGDMTYKVTGIKTKTQVGPEFLVTKAKGKFLVVSVEVTNNSNDSVLVNSSFFKLKSGEKTFEADSSASFSANSQDDQNSFLAEDLNPDLSMSGYIVFDVSEKVATAKNNILQAQTGFWGTETVDIALTK